ncbi:hypothetical protein AKO1_009205 [Acrasis kona]|uniref:MADS-box domain-containing protein n=1 Tax=Acrasis kona TaxID=1008807 RepID=A0AAW2ZL27_9EUKA
MGRKKIIIKPIGEERNRHVTFNKRKSGLIKKAMELSILCNCQISLVIFNDENNLFEYCSTDPRFILQRYCQVAHLPHERLANSDYARFNKSSGSKKKGTTSGQDNHDDDDDDDDDNYSQHSQTSQPPQQLQQQQLQQQQQHIPQQVQNQQVPLQHQLQQQPIPQQVQPQQVSQQMNTSQYQQQFNQQLQQQLQQQIQQHQQQQQQQHIQQQQPIRSFQQPTQETNTRQYITSFTDALQEPATPTLDEFSSSSHNQSFRSDSYPPVIKNELDYPIQKRLMPSTSSQQYNLSSYQIENPNKRTFSSSELSGLDNLSEDSPLHQNKRRRNSYLTIQVPSSGQNQIPVRMENEDGKQSLHQQYGNRTYEDFSVPAEKTLTQSGNSSENATYSVTESPLTLSTPTALSNLEWDAKSIRSDNPIV